MKYFLFLLLNFVQTILAVLNYGFIYKVLRELKINFFDMDSFINFDFIFENFFFDNILILFLYFLNIPLLLFSYFILLIFNSLIFFKILERNKVNTLFYLCVIIILLCFFSNIKSYTSSQLNDFMWSVISIFITSFFIYFSTKKIMKLVD